VAESAIERAGVTLARAVWTRRLARLGFASKATVYAVVATLAMGAAAGVVRVDPTDTRGAIVHIGQGVLGRGIVFVLAAGFLGLALWFVVEAAWNPRPSANAVIGAVSRIGQAMGGLGYVGLGIWAAEFALYGGDTRTSNTVVQRLTAESLQTTHGRVLLLVAAAVVVVVGVRQIRIGAKRIFESWLALRRMKPRVRRLAAQLGTFGFCTQGTILTFIGISLAVAVFEQQSSEAAGFDGVLRGIAAMPYGKVVLAIVGFALLSYAAFAVFEGKCKRMNPEIERSLAQAAHGGG
jgi:hypothetical protein